MHDVLLPHIMRDSSSEPTIKSASPQIWLKQEISISKSFVFTSSRYRSRPADSLALSTSLHRPTLSQDNLSDHASGAISLKTASSHTYDVIPDFIPSMVPHSPTFHSCSDIADSRSLPLSPVLAHSSARRDCRHPKDTQPPLSPTFHLPIQSQSFVPAVPDSQCPSVQSLHPITLRNSAYISEHKKSSKAMSLTEVFSRLSDNALFATWDAMDSAVKSNPVSHIALTKVNKFTEDTFVPLQSVNTVRHKLP